MNPHISAFISAARSRIFIIQILRSASLAMAISAFIACCHSLYYIVRGYAVDSKTVYPISLFLAIAFLVIHFMIKKMRRDMLIHFLDNYFSCKEALITAFNLCAKKEKTGFDNLQIQRTADICQTLNIKSIPYNLCRKTTTCAFLFISTAFLLSFVSDSPERIKQRQDKEIAQKSMLSIKEKIERQIQNIEKDLPKNQQKQLLQFRQKLAHTKEPTSIEEALKQLASLEASLHKIKSSQWLKNDENFLTELGFRLSQFTDSRMLGIPLKEKNYLQAQRNLKRLQKMPEELTEEKKKKLEQLRKLMKKIAEMSSDSKTDSQLKKKLENMQYEMPNSEENLDDMIKRLKKALEDLENGILKVEQARNFNQRLQQFINQLGAEQNKINQHKNGKGFKSQNPKDQKPGNGIGEGTDPKTLPPQELPETKGETTRITGIKGEGQSQKITQESQVGSASTKQKFKDKKAQFHQSFEALIQRQDIPADKKKSVRNYFNLINQNSEKLEQKQ